MTSSSQILAPTFACRLEEWLDYPKEVGPLYATKISPSLGLSFRIAGRLPLWTHGETGNVSARITISVSPEWMESPPSVQVHEQFMRPGLDWHASSDIKLCYVLATEWADTLSQLESHSHSHEYLLSSAVAWCFASIDSLCVRHLIAHRQHLTHWPAQWDYYSHFDKGVQEYISNRNARQRKAGSK